MSLAALAADPEPDLDLAAFSAITREKTAAQQAEASKRAAPPEQHPALDQRRAEHVGNIVALGAKAPKSPAINLEAAKALADVNEPSRAKPFADRAVELAPRSPEARVARGNVRFALGDYRAAQEDARSALALDPKNESAKGLLRFSESRLTDMAARVKVPSRQPSREPRQPETEAESSLAAAAGPAAGPAAPIAPSSAGTAGLRPARPAADANAGPPSIAGRDVAAARHAKASDALREAHAKLRLGDPAAAARLGRKASLLAPGDAEVRARAAHLRLKSGDAAGALEEARLATALGPRPRADTLLLLAAAQYATGEAEQGRTSLSRAASLSPRLESLLRLSAAGPSPELEKAVALELSAAFTPAYETALAGLDGGGPGAERAAPAAAPPDRLARRVRTALSAAGVLLALGAGLLWLKARRNLVS